MYYQGQIVHNLDSNRPTGVALYDRKGRYMRLTHYIHVTNVDAYKPIYSIALPKSVKEARALIKKGLITPAPIPPTHHWRCRNWLSNHDVGRCKCEHIIQTRPHLAGE